MIVWRLEKERHLGTALQGIGSAKAPGRWNFKGERVVYCAEHPGLALLEILVHFEIDIEDLPPYRLLEIETPGRSVSRQETIPEQDALCAQIGSDWVRSGRTLLLRVPSVIVPRSWNLLINPSHPEISEVEAVAAHEFRFDPRLFGYGAPPLGHSRR